MAKVCSLLLFCPYHWMHRVFVTWQSKSAILFTNIHRNTRLFPLTWRWLGLRLWFLSFQEVFLNFESRSYKLGQVGATSARRSRTILNAGEAAEESLKCPRSHTNTYKYTPIHTQLPVTQTFEILALYVNVSDVRKSLSKRVTGQC